MTSLLFSSCTGSIPAHLVQGSSEFTRVAFKLQQGSGLQVSLRRILAGGRSVSPAQQLSQISGHKEGASAAGTTEASQPLAAPSLSTSCRYPVLVVVVWERPQGSGGSWAGGQHT